MTSLPTLSLWAAFLHLFWRATRWRGALFGVLVLVVGLVPTAIMLATGVLVQAIATAAADGWTGAAGRAVWPAFAVLIGCLAAGAIGRAMLPPLTRLVNSLFSLEVHRTIARVTLGRSSLAFLDDPRVAEKLQAVQDADDRGVLWQTAMRLVSLAHLRIGGAAALVILLAFQWWAPVLLWGSWHLVNRVFQRVIERGGRTDLTQAARQGRAHYLRSLVTESSAAKEVRVFGLGEWMVGRYADAWMAALRMRWRSRRAHRGLTWIATLALAVSHAVVLGALAVAAGRGDLTIAALVVFVQAVIASHAIGLAGDSHWWFAQSLTMAGQLAELEAWASDRPAAPAAHTPRAPVASTPRAIAVRLSRVTFTYAGRDRPTLTDLSIDIPAGQSLAIVGSNGAGKSTVIKLLCGLYEPNEGIITLDAMPPAQSRARIGVIFQDFVRYKLPLRENVGFGHLPLLHCDDVLNAALRDAGGGELLARLPRKWDTVLSREFTDGVDLSGGEWQTVALARSLVAVRGGAGLLILDEPTASLDVRAETALFERFLDLTRDTTTILVSHRLSSVRHADRIVVLDEGRVVEDGTHHALIRAGGRYAGMFALQAERFAAPRPEPDGAVEAVAHA